MEHMDFFSQGGEHAPETAVSITLASIWLAFDAILDLFSCPDDSFTPTKQQLLDHEAMMEFYESNKDPVLWIRDQLPVKWWEREAKSYQAALVREVEKGSITAFLMRKSFPDGSVIPEKTLLTRSEIQLAMQGFGMGTSEVFNTTMDRLDDGLCVALVDYYDMTMDAEYRREALLMSQDWDRDQTVAVALENLKFKAQMREARKKADESPTKAALLLIGRALEVYQRDNPRTGTQSLYVDELLNGEKLHGLGKTSINTLLAEAKKTLKDARNT